METSSVTNSIRRMETERLKELLAHAQKQKRNPEETSIIISAIKSELTYREIKAPAGGLAETCERPIVRQSEQGSVPPNSQFGTHGLFTLSRG